MCVVLSNLPGHKTALRILQDESTVLHFIHTFTHHSAWMITECGRKFPGWAASQQMVFLLAFTCNDFYITIEVFLSVHDIPDRTGPPQSQSDNRWNLIRRRHSNRDITETKPCDRYVCLDWSEKSHFLFLFFLWNALIETVIQLLSEIKTDDSLLAITRRQNQWTVGKIQASLQVYHQDNTSLQCNIHKVKINILNIKVHKHWYTLL